MDVAQIGVAFDSTPVKDGKAALDALVPSAQRVEKAVGGISAAARGMLPGLSGVASGARVMQGALGAAATGAGVLSRSALMAGSSLGTVREIAIGASNQINILGGAVTRVGTTFAQADAHVTLYKNTLSGIPAAANTAKSALDRLGASANDNINRMQSTPGNIAAQFQDIGVTAAGGMSPMLIALQQGTQLSSAFANGMQDIGPAIRQILSPTTLLTIGLVGLAAAGLQAVDWAALMERVLNGLADAMVPIAPYAVGIAAALALVYSPAILGGLWTLTKMFYGLAASMLSTLGIPVLIVAGLTAVVVAAIHWRDEMTEMLGVDIVQAAHDGINTIVGSFVGAYNTIIRVWDQLPDALGDAAFRASSSVSSELNKLFTLRDDTGDVVWQPFSGGVGSNPYAGALDRVGSIAAGEMRSARQTDYVGGAIGGVRRVAGQGADWLRGVAGGPSAAELAAANAGGSAAALAASATPQRNPYAEMVTEIEREIVALETERRALGMSASAAALYRNQQELLARATAQGIPLTEANTAAFNTLANRLTSAQIANEYKRITNAADDQIKSLNDQRALIGLYGTELEYVTNRQRMLNDAEAAGVIDMNNLTDAMRQKIAVMTNAAFQIAELSTSNNLAEWSAQNARAHRDEMWSLERLRGELGLTGVALEAHRIETDLLASARAKNLVLDPTALAGLKAQAVELANTSSAIERMREQIEFNRSATNGFFSDLLSGLQSGESAWKSFGSAVMSVVNSILGRLINGTGGSGGVFSLIQKVLGVAAPQASLVGSASAAISANPELFADGGAFGGGEQITRFAKGGAFTNTVVSRPTLFKFARGGALGEMGEAGPEAIMPLKRGSNGELGVQMHGGMEQRPIVIEVVAGEYFDVRVDGRAQNVVVANAPAIASAGATITESESMFEMSRRIG